MNKIHENAINLYQKNISYLEKVDNNLYKKIKLFEEALNLNHISQKYILEYNDNYFDVFDNEKNSWLYK